MRFLIPIFLLTVVMCGAQSLVLPENADKLIRKNCVQMAQTKRIESWQAAKKITSSEEAAMAFLSFAEKANKEKDFKVNTEDFRVLLSDDHWFTGSTWTTMDGKPAFPIVLCVEKDTSAVFYRIFTP